MKICPVGAELLRADGQTDTDTAKLVICFHSFAKAPKTCEFPQSEKPVIQRTCRQRSRFYGCSSWVG